MVSRRHDAVSSGAISSDRRARSACSFASALRCSLNSATRAFCFCLMRALRRTLRASRRSARDMVLGVLGGGLGVRGWQGVDLFLFRVDRRSGVRGVPVFLLLRLAGDFAKDFFSFAACARVRGVVGAGFAVDFRRLRLLGVPLRRFGVALLRDRARLGFDSFSPEFRLGLDLDAAAARRRLALCSARTSSSSRSVAIVRRVLQRAARRRVRVDVTPAEGRGGGGTSNTGGGACLVVAGACLWRLAGGRMMPPPPRNGETVLRFAPRVSRFGKSPATVHSNTTGLPVLRAREAVALRRRWGRARGLARKRGLHVDATAVETSSLLLFRVARALPGALSRLLYADVALTPRFLLRLRVFASPRAADFAFAGGAFSSLPLFSGDSSSIGATKASLCVLNVSASPLDARRIKSGDGLVTAASGAGVWTRGVP